MTSLALSHRRTGAGVASHPFLFATVLVRKLRRRLRIRNDRRLLQAMPDYILTDLGISRSEIESALNVGRSRGLTLR